MPITNDDLATILSRPGYHLAAESPPSKPIPQTATNRPSEGVPPAGQPRGVNARPHKSKTDYKSRLVQDLGFLGIDLEPEFKFSPTRKYRADWRITRYCGKDVRIRKVLIEFEGGLFSAGKRGHSSIAGILRDIAKINEAQLCGFIMIRVAPSDVVSGQAVQWIEQAIKMRAKKYADRV